MNPIVPIAAGGALLYLATRDSGDDASEHVSDTEDGCDILRELLESGQDVTPDRVAQVIAECRTKGATADQVGALLAQYGVTSDSPWLAAGLALLDESTRDAVMDAIEDVGNAVVSFATGTAEAFRRLFGGRQFRGWVEGDGWKIMRHVPGSGYGPNGRYQVAQPTGRVFATVETTPVYPRASDGRGRVQQATDRPGGRRGDTKLGIAPLPTMGEQAEQLEALIDAPVDEEVMLRLYGAPYEVPQIDRDPANPTNRVMRIPDDIGLGAFQVRDPEAIRQTELAFFAWGNPDKWDSRGKRTVAPATGDSEHHPLWGYAPRGNRSTLYWVTVAREGRFFVPLKGERVRTVFAFYAVLPTVAYFQWERGLLLPDDTEYMTARPSEAPVATASPGRTVGPSEAPVVTARPLPFGDRE